MKKTANKPYGPIKQAMHELRLAHSANNVTILTLKEAIRDLRTRVEDVDSAMGKTISDVKQVRMEMQELALTTVANERIIDIEKDIARLHLMMGALRLRTNIEDEQRVPVKVSRAGRLRELAHKFRFDSPEAQALCAIADWTEVAERTLAANGG